MIKIIFPLLLILLLTNCGKPKSVLVCGDHVCINKSEAEQYFEENLSIEVKIIKKKKKKEFDLVELNLKKDNLGNRKISVSSKQSTKKNLKILSAEEINKIKKNIKTKKNNREVAKQIINQDKEKKAIYKNSDQKNNKITKINVNNKRKDIVDVCTILEKCSIDEISKYLLKQGKKKKFPDITKRQ